MTSQRHMGACDGTIKGKITENQLNYKVVIMIPRSLEFQNQVQLLSFHPETLWEIGIKAKQIALEFR